MLDNAVYRQRFKFEVKNDGKQKNEKKASADVNKIRLAT